MRFLELVNTRYSARNYQDTPVSREALDRCVEAVRLAPSACNSQPWTFIIVDDPTLKEQLAKAAFGGLPDFNHFVFKAPVLVLIVAERQKAFAKIGGLVKKKNFRLMDIGIAAEHFCLQATEEGLGTCLLGWFDEKKVKRLLSVPARKRIELMISVGYSADEKPPQKNRKSTTEMSSYNDYR